MSGLSGVVQGNDAYIELHDGDSYKPFVCAKDMSISPKTTYVNIATYGDGMWDKWSPQSHGYTVSLSGVAAFRDGSITVWDLLERQLQGLETKFRAIYTDVENVNTRVIQGYLFIDTTNISANVGQVALGDLSLIGNGRLVLSACSVFLEGITVEVTDDDIEVTIDGVEGDPDYFIYQVDSDFEQTTLSNPFTVVGIAGGFHTITVLPVCTGGNRGLEVSADFSIEVNTPVTTCPNVTGLTIDNITRTGFTVSWIRPVGAATVNLYIKNLVTQTEIPFLNQTVSTIDITGLANDTTYSARVITNCDDATQSGGITVNAATLPAPTSIRLVLFNHHPTAVLNAIDINPTEGPLDIEFGSFPVQPLTQLVLRNIPTGARNIVFFFDTVVAGTVSVNAESGLQTDAISGGTSFTITIGSGGVDVTIDP